MQYSVIIPVFNEERNIKLLLDSVEEVMDNLGGSYEIIFVNDGSTDGTSIILNQMTSESKHLRVINFNKNLGQSQTMQAGFVSSTGEIIITLDGDLQNDPRDIPRLLEKMKEGYDVVCGWRRKRQSPVSKKIASRLANLLRWSLLGEKIHDVGCSLRVYKKEALKDIRLNGQMHTFLTALLLFKGFKIGELEVNDFPRRFGKSKYRLRDRIFSGLRDFSIIFSSYKLSLLFRISKKANK